MKKKIRHCCELMDINLLDGRVQLFYDEIQRHYYIPLINMKSVQTINFCPFCGKNYPII